MTDQGKINQVVGILRLVNAFPIEHTAKLICQLFKPENTPTDDGLLTFTQEQIVGLIPAQAIIDYDRAKEVLEKVAKAQRDLTRGEYEGWKSLEEVKSILRQVVAKHDEIVLNFKAEYEARIAALKADKFTYCAYCGEEFPIDSDGTPAAVSAHIQNCPKHPMQDYKRECQKEKEEFVKQLESHSKMSRFDNTAVGGQDNWYRWLDEDWWQSLKAKFLARLLR